MSAMNVSCERTKIFVSAYGCEPDQGSEIGVGWHWVLELSNYYDLWVLTRESNRANIEGWMSNHKLDHPPTFVYYDLPHKWRRWKKGLRGVRIYYALWQHFSDRVVRETMQRNNIAIYHQLTYGNALWRVSRYGQKQTFVWGPIVAGECLDRQYTRHYTLRGQLKEFAQYLASVTLKYNFGFRSRCRNADLILCKTEQTWLSVDAKYRDKAIVVTDVAADIFDPHVMRYSAAVSSEKVRLLAAGRLEGWRGFDLLIEAMAVATRQNPSLYLDILGSGGDRQRLESMVTRYSLGGNISLRGHVSQEDYYRYMSTCDVVVNPSLKEGGVTLAFDSVSFSKPLICIDSGGYTNLFSGGNAIVLPRTDRAQTIEELSDALLQLCDPDRRSSLLAEVDDLKSRLSWRSKGAQIYEIFRQRLCIK